VPDVDPESNVSATESCILVACFPEVDGPTEITLGPAHGVDPGDTPAFDGRWKRRRVRFKSPMSCGSRFYASREPWGRREFVFG
jgi:hypothetical protein